MPTPPRRPISRPVSRPLSRSIWLGGSSVAIWFCCPFWATVCYLALPLGVAGLWYGIAHHRSPDKELRAQARTGLALAAVGTAAAVAYLIFLATHPDILIQD